MFDAIAQQKIKKLEEIINEQNIAIGKNEAMIKQIQLVFDRISVSLDVAPYVAIGRTLISMAQHDFKETDINKFRIHSPPDSRQVSPIDKEKLSIVLEQELEDLTISLFEEANKLVIKVQKDNKKLWEENTELKLKIDEAQRQFEEQEKRFEILARDKIGAFRLNANNTSQLDQLSFKEFELFLKDPKKSKLLQNIKTFEIDPCFSRQIRKKLFKEPIQVTKTPKTDKKCFCCGLIRKCELITKFGLNLDEFCYEKIRASENILSFLKEIDKKEFPLSLSEKYQLFIDLRTRLFLSRINATFILNKPSV